jgi:hypothetical protein
MLTISKQQEQQLEGPVERQFAGRVIEFLSQQLPDAVARIERKTFEERVLADLQQARLHGIRSDADLAKWCFIALVCGPKFHEAEDVQGFLKEPLMTAAVKMDFLMRSLAHALAKKQQ